MALGVFHSDGVTPIDIDHPLHCSYSTPGVAIFKCSSGEVTSDSVVLSQLPAEAECSVDGVSWGILDIGVVGAGGTSVKIRPSAAYQGLGFALTVVRGTYVGVIQPDMAGPQLYGLLTVSEGDASVVLDGLTAWDATGIDEWQYRVNGGVWVSVLGSDVTSMPAVRVTGLINGTTYTFDVRVLDVLGYPSVTRSVTGKPKATDSTVPVLSGTLLAVAGNESVTLSGLSAFDTSGIAKWQYRVGSFSWIDIPDSAKSTMPVKVVTGLPVGVSIDFQVRAIDASPAANESIPKVASATPVDTLVPSIYGPLVAVAGDSQVTLSGGRAVDSSGIAKWQYRIVGGEVVWVDIPNSAKEYMPSVVVGGLANEVQYDFYTRALDLYGNASQILYTSASPAGDVVDPSLSGPLVATAGNGQVSLEWPDGSDNVAVTGYRVRYKLSSEQTWTVLSPDPVVSSAVVTGLTNNQAYDFNVWALDGAGNTSGVLSATATPVNAVFVDDFSALDAERWGLVTSGSGTAGVADGELVLTSPSTVDAAAGYLLSPVPSGTRTYRLRARVTAQAATNSTVLFLGVQDGVPVVGAAVTGVFAKNLCMVRVADNGTAPYASITYYDTSGVLQRWNGSGWQTASVSLASSAYTLGNYIFAELDVTETQWRISTYDAAFNLLHRTAWVDWASTRLPSGSKYIAFGDLADDGIGCTLRADAFTLI